MARAAGDGAMASQMRSSTDPMRMTAFDGMFARVAPCEQPGLPQSRECQHRRICRLIRFRRYIRISAKVIRGSADMSNPGQAHHHGQSRQDKRPVHPLFTELPGGDRPG
jgi:hypothetical protein